MSWVTDWNQMRERHEKAPPPVNDPKLMRMVKVKVLKPFWVKGKPAAVGDEVEIVAHVALDLARLGKCEILEK
jgi:hypothetical protein